MSTLKVVKVISEVEYTKFFIKHVHKRTLYVILPASKSDEFCLQAAQNKIDSKMKALIRSASVRRITCEIVNIADDGGMVIWAE